MTKWWNKKYGKEQLCSITYTRLRPKKSIFLKCGHGFCKSALIKWANIIIENVSFSTCPMCRKIFRFDILF